MSNVHGFGDAPQNPNQNRVNQYRNNDRPADGNGGFFEGLQEPVVESQLKVAHEHRILFVSGMKYLKNPRDENYWDMMAYSLCPTFTFLSLTFLIVAADIAVFIYLAVIGL